MRLAPEIELYFADLVYICPLPTLLLVLRFGGRS